MTPHWYAELAGVANLYLAVIAFVFLVRPPKVRTLAAAGVYLLALAVFMSAARVLWRVRPGGQLPIFRSDADAFSALFPQLIACLSLTLLVVARFRERFPRRRS